MFTFYVCLFVCVFEYLGTMVIFLLIASDICCQCSEWRIYIQQHDFLGGGVTVFSLLIFWKQLLVHVACFWSLSGQHRAPVELLV